MDNSLSNESLAPVFHGSVFGLPGPGVGARLDLFMTMAQIALGSRKIPFFELQNSSIN